MTSADKKILVSDIMARDPLTLDVDDVLDLASDILTLGRIRHLPILDKGRIAGVLSQRDLLHSALATALGIGRKESRDLLKSVRVREVMSARVVTVTPDTPVQEAARIMVAKKIGCLPVMADDRLVGLVTESDLLSQVAAS